jgi:O-antigen/teichoic acid export membrane protein
MKKKFFKDISASTIQVILNQLLGLLVFLITSRYLAKSAYGELNWSLAILTFIITVLSLRLEQVVVQKVAAGDNPSKALTLFAGHNFFAGLTFYLLLLLISVLFPVFFQQHNLLLILAVSQLLNFFALPFKQVVNGKEHFRLLTLMSSIANIIRSAWLLWVILFSVLTIQQVLLIYIVSAFAELVLNLYIVTFHLKIKLSRQWTIQDYYNLLRESLPQIGVVFLNACIARLDWILLGVFTTSAITAEYSFAYKIFELCPLPMLIAAPVLLSRFSKYFSSNTAGALLQKKTELTFFIRYAMIAATLIPLVLNIVWVPLIDALTENKYGAVNKTTFLLLSFSIPFQYMINLFWTIEFAQHQLSRIFRITAITCLIIVVGDLLMIPLLNGTGAAMVYLLATATEYIIYLRLSIFIKIKESWQSLLYCIAAAVSSALAVEYLKSSLYIKTAIAVSLYIVLLFISRQAKTSDWKTVKAWVGK